LYGQVLGLDIGSWSLKGVVARGGFGRFEILRYTGEFLREEGAPETGDPAAALSHALSQYRDVHQLAGMEPICTLPGPMTSTRRLSLPFSDPKKIRQTVPFEVESQVPYGIEEIVLDYQVSKRRPGTDVSGAGPAQPSPAPPAAGGRGLIPILARRPAANLAPSDNAGGLLFAGDVKTGLCALASGSPLGAHAWGPRSRSPSRRPRVEREAERRARGARPAAPSTRPPAR
jgi:hypothetical protein